LHVWSIEHSQTSLNDHLVLSDLCEGTILSMKYDYLVKAPNCLGFAKLLVEKICIIYKHHIGLAKYTEGRFWIGLTVCLFTVNRGTFLKAFPLFSADIPSDVIKILNKILVFRHFFFCFTFSKKKQVCKYNFLERCRLLLHDWCTFCYEKNVIMSREMRNASTCTEVFVAEFRLSAKSNCKKQQQGRDNSNLIAKVKTIIILIC